MNRRSACCSIAAVLAVLVVVAVARPAYADIEYATIDGRGTLFAGGTQAIITGLVQTSTNDVVVIRVTLQQTKGNKTVTATGFNPLGFFLEAGKVQAWAMAVQAPVGETFGAGPALVSVRFETNTDLLHIPARVSLHR